MNFGEAYARAYDAFYRAKDYPAEARFVVDRLRAILSQKSFSILDIGCGTGLHDIELVQAGYNVTGVDASADMLEQANDRRFRLLPEMQGALRFLQGDARTFDVGQTYDAVISLFHVMSYMSGEADFDMALGTIRRHLPYGGAFLFDVWFGPAVLADPPQRRQREVREGGKHINRTTTPYWEKDKNLVRITLDVVETDIATGHSKASCEEHLMRYFSIPDLEHSLSNAGFELVEICEWLSGNIPSEQTFGVYVLARAV